MPWSRKKSCERCRASKARCNQATPTCSRCSERQLQCIYDRWDSNRAAHYSYALRTASFIDNPTESSWTRISSQLELDSSEAETCVADQPFSIGVEETLPDFDQQLQLDWNAADTLTSADLSAIKTLELPGLETQQQVMAQRYGFLTDPLLLHMTSAGIPSEGLPNRPSRLYQNLSNGPIVNQSSSQVTLVTEQHRNRRSLMKRGAHKGCPLTSIVLGQIISYPEMMIAGDQLPPFIQPPCHIDEELAQDCAESGKHKCLPKDLAVCSSFVQMFYQRTVANASFGWKLIYEEVERLHKEYHNLTSQERLAALQSTTVYLILQAKDSDSAAKNGVSSLLETVTEMAFDLTKNSDWHLDISQGRPDRRDWVFRESLRRIIVLLSIIDLLLEGIIMTTANSCHDFGEVPLPSTRDLWGARTNRGWRTNYASYISNRKTNEVLTVRDLIESDEAGCFTNSKNNARNIELFPDVTKWCEGLDQLGTLIWMVIPFEQHRRRNLTQEFW